MTKAPDTIRVKGYKYLWHSTAPTKTEAEREWRTFKRVEPEYLDYRVKKVPGGYGIYILHPEDVVDHYRMTRRRKRSKKR
jgi:hypothetical protein